jgi:peroxiredoxin
MVFLSLVGLGFFSVSGLLAQIGGHDARVQPLLEARKEAFMQSAEPERIADYEEGIRQVAASGVLERAKGVGDAAPSFRLPDVTGEMVALSALLKHGPVVLIWYRGEWCPYCNIHLQHLQAHLPTFKNAGAQVVAISPEIPDRGFEMQERLNLGFHVLSDKGSHVAEDWGVVYRLPAKIADYLEDAFGIQEANDDQSNRLPLAASYVIAPDGTIVYAFVDADYRKRADAEDLLRAVRLLQQ